MGEGAELAMNIEFSKIARAAGGRWINDVDEDGIPYDEDFEEEREYHKKKTASNRAYSTKLLLDRGVEFESKNNGAHLIVMAKGNIFDFWPGTGKYKLRTASEYKRGVFNLLKDIEEATPVEPQGKHCFHYNEDFPASYFRAPGCTWCIKCETL